MNEENKNNKWYGLAIAIIIALATLFVFAILISSLRILFKIVVTGIGLGLICAVAYGVFNLCKMLVHKLK